MKRRQFITRTALLGAAGLVTPVPKLYGSEHPDYSGPLLATLQIDGGWDVTSYCDPKENQVGERKITNWSDSNSTQVAGNLPYAPIANNQWFFEKHH